MTYIDGQLLTFKQMIENAIINGGSKGKESIIRSSQLINLIHDAVKEDLIQHGIDPDQIYPHLNQSKPEIKLAGFLKQKDQDICVVPKNIAECDTPIKWGPMAFQNKTDPYGEIFTENTLVINVRSQMSSLAKNSDTLFERTFAEAENLHKRCPNMVLGEVYLIPVNEYDDEAVKINTVKFKDHQTDIEKYISFFDSINGRRIGGDDYMYEKCALLIVDFSKPYPRLFKNSAELKAAGLISGGFSIEYATLAFDSFTDDILRVYASRYNINNIL